MPLGMTLAMISPRSLTSRALDNPKVSKIGPGPAEFDRPEYWRVENGGSGGIGDARSIARLYGAFATGGASLGVGRATLDELEADAQRPRRGWKDKILKPMSTTHSA